MAKANLIIVNVSAGPQTRQVYVNADLIRYIYPGKDGTTGCDIHFGDNDILGVTQSATEVANFMLSDD